MANHIIRMKQTEKQPVNKNNMVIMNDKIQKDTENCQNNDYPNFIPYVFDTMTDPQTRILQEIRFLLCIIILIEAIRYFKHQ